MRATWAALTETWAATLEQAGALPEAAWHERLGGEWSFVETVRHLIFAMDKWFTDPILGEPFHPIGLPNSGSADFPWPRLDPSAAPTASDVLAVRAERCTRFGDHLASLTAMDTGTVEVLENGTVEWRECFLAVFEEEFWHNRYARRDIAALRTTST
jgi:hypothetical protein